MYVVLSFVGVCLSKSISSGKVLVNLVRFKVQISGDVGHLLSVVRVVYFLQIKSCCVVCTCHA